MLINLKSYLIKGTITALSTYVGPRVFTNIPYTTIWKVSGVSSILGTITTPFFYLIFGSTKKNRLYWSTQPFFVNTMSGLLIRSIGLSQIGLSSILFSSLTSCIPSFVYNGIMSRLNR